MKKRKLFQAIIDNKIVAIEKVDKENNKKYLCPHCKKEVIPKLGEKNVWHFAHKDKSCDYMNSVDEENSELKNFITKTTSKIEVPEDPNYFLCFKCRKKFPKENAIKWEEKKYLCKNCFRML